MGISKDQAPKFKLPNYTNILDVALITLNANSSDICQNFYLDTVRTAVTINYSNFIDGSIVVVKLKKQSVSNLTITISSATIGFGNVINNQVVLAGLANSYFELVVEARDTGAGLEFYGILNPL